MDTALTYGTATQESVGAAIKASGLARSAIFLDEELIHDTVEKVANRVSLA